MGRDRRRREARPRGEHRARRRVCGARVDVGLSEKLYAELATTPFRAAHRASVATRAPLPATVAGGPPFTLHLDVATQVDVILREVLPNGAVPPEWQQWLIAIDTLEGRFLLACANPAAAAVGLPWGVVLACVLRAYVIELVGRTLTALLPVEQVHEEVDGYLGVALWEALTGSLASTPWACPATWPACTAGDPVLTALSGWRVDGFTSAWSPTVPGAGPGGRHQADGAGGGAVPAPPHRDGSAGRGQCRHPRRTGRASSPAGRYSPRPTSPGCGSTTDHSSTARG